MVPHQSENVKIYNYEVSGFKAEGEAITVSDFIQKNVKVLSNETEKNLVLEFANKYKDIVIPDKYRSPFTVNKKSSVTGEKVTQIQTDYIYYLKRNLSFRSIYDRNDNVKIHGCMPIVLPISDNQLYPNLFFQSKSNYTYSQNFPFGTHNVEGIMRRLLGNSFCEKYEIPNLLKPFAVWEYKYGNEIIGYALLSSQPTDLRLDDYGLRAFTSYLYPISMFDGQLFDPRIRVNKLLTDMLDLLFKLHSNNGFRGICNSHMNNFLLFDNQIYMVDYETFHVKETLNTSRNLMDHYMNSMAELMEVSLPIIRQLKFWGKLLVKYYPNCELSKYIISDSYKCDYIFIQYHKKLNNYYQSLGLAEHIDYNSKEMQDYYLWLDANWFDRKSYTYTNNYTQLQTFNEYLGRFSILIPDNDRYNRLLTKFVEQEALCFDHGQVTLNSNST